MGAFAIPSFRVFNRKKGVKKMYMSSHAHKRGFCCPLEVLFIISLGDEHPRSLYSGVPRVQFY